MKKVIRMVVLSAMMCFGAQAMAQTHGAAFAGLSIPTGDFRDFDNMSDFALATVDATNAGAGLGFNAGIKWYFNVGVEGLGVMLSVDGFYNGPNSDLKTAYRSTESASNLGFISGSFEYKATPRFINVPAMIGVNYRYEINPQLAVYGEGGLGGNLRLITSMRSVGKTEVLGVQSQVTTTQRYDGAFSFAFQFGAGVEVAKNLVLGVSYYNLGNAIVKGDQTIKTKTLNDNVTNSDTNYLTLGSVHPAMVLFRIGFRF